MRKQVKAAAPSCTHCSLQTPWSWVQAWSCFPIRPSPPIRLLVLMMVTATTTTVRTISIIAEIIMSDWSLLFAKCSNIHYGIWRGPLRLYLPQRPFGPGEPWTTRLDSVNSYELTDWLIDCKHLQEAMGGRQPSTSSVCSLETSDCKGTFAFTWLTYIYCSGLTASWGQGLFLVPVYSRGSANAEAWILPLLKRISFFHDVLWGCWVKGWDSKLQEFLPW